MTIEETEAFLRWATSLYPNVKWTTEQFAFNVKSWHKEFEKQPKAIVWRAFGIAQEKNPDWMPTTPRIKKAIESITPRSKTPEQEFKDSHCGKTREEWDKLCAWEKSKEGAQRIRSYKEQFNQLFNSIEESKQ